MNKYEQWFIAYGSLGRWGAYVDIIYNKLEISPLATKELVRARMTIRYFAKTRNDI